MKLTRAAYQKAFFPLLLLLSLAGILLILYATRWGAALSDNSYYYIKPARDMLAGQPYRLSPHYAPRCRTGWLPLGGWVSIRKMGSAT